MARFSQNGWPVLAREDTAIVRVAGGAFRVAPGTEPLWSAFVARFVAEVEPIAGEVLDDWSWADRPVRGSTTVISNHASATALDLNATKHPRGVRNTFTADQLARLRKILAAFPVLRWGGDFSTTVDDMHFEVNASPAEVAAFVKSLQPPEDDMPTADEVAKAVWQYGVQRRETEDPKDRIPAEDALGYAARWGYAGLTNDKAEAERDAGLIGRVVGLEQGQDTILAKIDALAAAVAALAPPVPPAGG